LNNWTKNKNKLIELNGSVFNDSDLLLKVKSESLSTKWTWRILSVMSIAWTLLVLLTETTLIFNHEVTGVYALTNFFKANIWATYLTSIVFICGITLTSFFTIFKLKFSDYLQLVPGHTDCVTFCSFTAICSKLVSVACFNFMVITGEVQLRAEELTRMQNEGFDSLNPDYYQTSFINFYSSMLATPYLGERYNVILPGCILLFAAIFILSNIFNYEEKAVRVIRNLDAKFDELENG
jgi:hypothetical protein